MIEIIRNILRYAGIFRISKVKDKEEQKEYTKVVIIVGVVVSAAILLTKLLII